MEKTKVSIVIVSWNVRELLKKCLTSVYKFQENLELQVIVVDNNSNDGTAEMIKNDFPQSQIIANSDNRGFAAANNQGILESKGDYILVLNPDTEIVKNSLEKMIAFMQSNEKIGIGGCKHLNTNLTLQASVRNFPVFWAIFFIFTKLTKIFPNIPPVYYYLAKDFDYKTTQKVAQVSGSFMMIRRQVMDQIGLFDEDFFIWFEEVDLCKRATNSGWEIWYDSRSVIIHHGAQSFKQQMTIKKQIMFFKSAVYYFRKHGLKL